MPNVNNQANTPSAVEHANVRSLRVAVCQNDPDLIAGSPLWDGLCGCSRRLAPDLLLLNELPFGPWVGAADTFDRAEWARSCRAHEAGLARTGELGAAVVAGTRPRDAGGARVNEAFVWTAAEGVRGVHTKQHFPDEEGYYEARWFDAGESASEPVAVAGVRVAFLICTELMFNERARRYARRGAQILLVPRAVGPSSLERWLVAMRMAAIVSGCYVLSSNRAGRSRSGQTFGGTGWIIDPNGDVVAQTSHSASIVSHQADLDFVRRAQSGYPCYVKE